MTKVLLPKEVAKAIEELNCWSIDLIVSNGRNTPESSYGIILDWMNAQGDGSFRMYFDAMVNGYMVERTPHERLAKYYETYQIPRIQHKGYVKFDRGVMRGIEETLRILGITVEGINSKDNGTEG